MASPITFTVQKGVTIPAQNGVILPTCLLQHIRNYLYFLTDDNFPLTCRLWHSLLPNTLNLELRKYSTGWNFGDKLFSIFQRYQQKSQPIVALDLSYWEGLTDDHLIPLSNYNLHTLKLRRCHKLTERVLTYLKTPSSLTHLDLSFTKIRDFSLAELTKFPLKHLDISYVDDVADDNLETIAQLPQLTCLDLSNCKKLTDKGHALLPKLPLQVLTIGGSESCNITDETVSILGNCRSLTDLDMTDCPGITNLSPLKSLSLKRLNVAWCTNISNFQITTYLKDHEMESLNLRYFVLQEIRDLIIFRTDRAWFNIIACIVNYVP